MFEAAKGLAARGHEVWVGGRIDGDLEAACADANLPFIGVRLRNPLGPGSAWRLRHHLRSHEIDIVHVHKGRAHGAGLFAAIGLGRDPRMVVNRGVSFPLDAFNKWKYRHPRVGAVVCVADAVRDTVIRSGGLRPGRVHTIHGSTNAEVFDPVHTDGARVRNELGLDSGKIVVGQVSVRDWKGWSDLVAAFTGVAAGFPDARLLFVGCEPEAERAKVERAAHDANLGNRILTTGFRTDMPEVLAACDVVVLPYLEATGSGVLKLAYGCGRSVIASRVGSLGDEVVDGKTGLLVRPGDAGELADALIRFYREDLRDTLETGVLQQRRQFSWQAAVSALQRLSRHPPVRDGRP
jgi:glycosyltransferase involved in cell wall biosynthesis